MSFFYGDTKTDELVVGQSSTSNGYIDLYDSGSSNKITLRAPNSITTSYNLTLPSTNGTEDQVITINGTDGNMLFADAAPSSNRVIFQVKNESGDTITQGTPVYFDGISGQSVLVAPADASDPSKMPAGGILNETLDNHQSGILIEQGKLTNIDMTSYSVNDSLYVAVGGGLSNVKPGYPNLIQNIVRVTKNVANGSLIVTGPSRTNDVPNLGDSNIWIGKGAGFNTVECPVSGDVTMSNVGVFTINSISNTATITSTANITMDTDQAIIFRNANTSIKSSADSNLSIKVDNTIFNHTGDVNYLTISSNVDASCVAVSFIGKSYNSNSTTPGSDEGKTGGILDILATNGSSNISGESLIGNGGVININKYGYGLGGNNFNNNAAGSGAIINVNGGQGGNSYLNTSFGGATSVNASGGIGGSILINAGSGGTGYDGGNGGDLSFTAGYGGSGSNSSGINGSIILASNGSSNISGQYFYGSGGAININKYGYGLGGNNFNNNAAGTGSSINLNGGQGGNSYLNTSLGAASSSAATGGYGGSIYLYGGSGGTGYDGGDGGDISFTAGYGGSGSNSSGKSGNIYLNSNITSFNSNINFDSNISLLGTKKLYFNSNSYIDHNSSNLNIINNESSGSIIIKENTNNNTLSISSSNVSITASNITQTISSVSSFNTMSGQIVYGVNTFTAGGASDITRVQFKSSTNYNSVKSIIQSTSSDNSTHYFNANSGGKTGEIMNILYYNANASGSANIDFNTTNLYSGTGANRYLELSSTGQGASLIWIDNASATIAGWRIINTGGAVRGT